MNSRQEDMEWIASETRNGNRLAAIDPRYRPGSWRAPVPEAFRLSDDGFLEWSPPDRAPDQNGVLRDATVDWWRAVQPDAAMLDRFLSLADGGGQDVRTFACQYGPLAPGVLTKVPLPAIATFIYPTRLLDIIELRPYSSRSPEWAQVPACRESVKGWITLAREARAMIAIARHLHRGELAREEDWQVIREATSVEWPGFVGGGCGPYDPPLIWVQRMWLKYFVAGWSAGAIRGFSIDWWDSAPTVSLEGFMLFGALVLRLAGRIVRSDQLEVCANCGELFQARQHGGRKHPPHCRRKACQAAMATLRTRTMRAKQKSEADAKGISVAELKRQRKAAKAGDGAAG